MESLTGVFHLGPSENNVAAAWLGCGSWPEGSGVYSIIGESAIQIVSRSKKVSVHNIPAEVMNVLATGPLYGLHGCGSNIWQYKWELAR